MSEEEKNPVEKAMEKDCIILVVASIIVVQGFGMSANTFNTKCRGPACATYNVFTNRCGLLR